MERHKENVVCMRAHRIVTKDKWRTQSIGSHNTTRHNTHTHTHASAFCLLTFVKEQLHSRFIFSSAPFGFDGRRGSSYLNRIEYVAVGACTSHASAYILCAPLKVRWCSFRCARKHTHTHIVWTLNECLQSWHFISFSVAWNRNNETA